jgi:hypothetical protein
MKATSIYLLASLVVGTMPAQASIGGSGAGNGADYAKPENGSAWFLTRIEAAPRPIRFCIEASPSFGYTPHQLADMLRDAAATWESYMMKRGLIRAQDYLTFTLKLEEQPRCGSEDLRLYFGVTSPEVEAHRSAFDAPLGFSVRTAYDVRAGWGKGFIWVAAPGSVIADEGYPDWSRKDSLQALLLHEFGHVLGSAHMPLTIMDPALGKRIRQHYGAQLACIDQENYFIPDDARSWGHVYQEFGVVGSSSDHRVPGRIATIFKTFTGRAPVGKIRAKLKTLADNPRYRGLTLWDDAGETIFPLPMLDQQNWVSFPRGSPAFKLYARPVGQRPQSFSVMAGGSAQPGLIDRAAGDPCAVTLVVNSVDEQSRLMLTYSCDLGSGVLFRQTEKSSW